jgi:hypothetical protein
MKLFAQQLRLNGCEGKWQEAATRTAENEDDLGLQRTGESHMTSLTAD